MGNESSAVPCSVKMIESFEETLKRDEALKEYVEKFGECKMIEKYLVLAKAKYETEPNKDPVFGENISEADDLIFAARRNNECLQEKLRIVAQALKIAPKLKGVTDVVSLFLGLASNIQNWLSRASGTRTLLF